MFNTKQNGEKYLHMKDFGTFKVYAALRETEITMQTHAN